MTAKITDNNLFKRIQQDDEAAFKALFNKHYKNVCYAAYKLYPDEHKAKDFAQEVFLNFWKRRKVINIQTSVPAFLKRAAANKAIDYIRAQRLDFEKGTVIETRKTKANEQTEYKELKDLIHETAKMLPERCRIIFFMSRFEGLSHKEIAAKLGITEKTIENQITKALKILRRVVAEYQTESKLIFIFLSFLLGDISF